MPRTLYLPIVSCLVCAPAMAGTVRGELAPLPAAKAHAAPAMDACFWRLGPPQEKQNPPSLVVLEGETAPVPADPAAEISLSGFAFQPALLAVTNGTRLTIQNRDSREYSCAAEGPGGFTIEKLPAYAATTKTLAAEGSLQLRCHGYPFLRATILVLPRALWAMVDADGKFQFANVPAGKYRARAYHHGAWHFESDVNVPAQGTVQIALGTTAAGTEKSPGEIKPPAPPTPPPPEKPKTPTPAEPPVAVKPPPEKAPPPVAPKPKPADTRPPKPAPKEPAGGFSDVEPEVEVEVE